MKKRLFIGTFIDTGLFENLYYGIKENYAPSCSGKWVELENLHFTYKFLGDVEEEKIQEIQKSLDDILKIYKSELLLKGMGVFPNPRLPKVLFFKIFNPGNDIFKAQQEIDNRLEPLGFKKEFRKFNPHLTLLRMKTSNKNFSDTLNKYKDYHVGSMPAFSINLIESFLTKKKPIYTIIK